MSGCISLGLHRFMTLLLNSSFRTAGIAILLSAKIYTSLSYFVGDIIAVNITFMFFQFQILKCFISKLLCLTCTRWLLNEVVHWMQLLCDVVKLVG